MSGRPRTFENRKTIINISVEPTSYETCVKKGLNISEICTDAIMKSAGTNFEDLDKKKEKLVEEISKLEETEKYLHKKVKDTDENRKVKIEEFKKDVAYSVLRNPGALSYWSRKTGLNEKELIDLKKGKIGYI